MYYFFTALFLLVASRANFLSYVEPLIYLFTAIYFIGGVQLNRFRQSDFKLFAQFTIIYFAFITLRFIFLNHVGITFYLFDISFYLKRLIFVFVYCAVLKEKAAYYIVKVTTHGALLSLFFYVLQLINGDMIFSIGAFINLPPRIGNPQYTNFFLFTYDQGQGFRNCGFVWEPGAFGCFLVMALLLHFLLNKFKFDRTAIILVLATITSLSTTAYMGLLFIMLFYYRVKGGKLAPLLFIAVPIIAVIAIEVPFLFDKIGKTYDSDQESLNSIDDLNEYYQRTGEGQIHLNRFGSATILWQTFKWQLLWGISNGYPGTSKALGNVNISNGDMDFMAKFGLIGYIFFMYRFGLLIKNFVRKNEYVFYAILTFLVLSFGEPMPIFHSSLIYLFLYKYVTPDKFELYNEEEENEEEEKEHEEENGHGAIALN
jgi:ABC-type multidrug transport system fused ATPase/permease subunit